MSQGVEKGGAIPPPPWIRLWFFTGGRKEGSKDATAPLVFFFVAVPIFFFDSTPLFKSVPVELCTTYPLLQAV